jgi:hypothetical protein
MTLPLKPRQINLPLMFLFLIGRLPTSTGLIASSTAAARMTIQRSHLVVIAAARLALRIETHLRVHARAGIVPSPLVPVSWATLWRPAVAGQLDICGGVRSPAHC